MDVDPAHPAAPAGPPSPEVDERAEMRVNIAEVIEAVRRNAKLSMPEIREAADKLDYQEHLLALTGDALQPVMSAVLS